MKAPLFRYACGSLMERRTAAVFAVLVLLLTGCANPFSTPNAAEEGSLTFRFSDGALSALTIGPGDSAAIETYHITGEGPNGASFVLSEISPEEPAVSKSGLVPGQWDIAAEARNAAGTVLLTSATEVTVAGGTGTVVTMVLEPVEGEGDLELRISWPTESERDLSVVAELEAVATEATEQLAFVPDESAGEGRVGVEYEGSWDAGYYVITIQLLDGEAVVWGDAAAVWVLAGEQTSREQELTDDDLMPPEDTPGSGESVWSYSVGSAFNASIWSSPAIDAARGRVYFGSDDGRLYAVTTGGSKEWEFETSARVVSSPAVGPDGTVYFGSFDNYIYALNPDGSERWSFQTGGWVRSSPAVDAAGNVYIGSNDGRVYGFTADGTQLSGFPFDTGQDVVSSPAIGADGTVYVGSSDGLKTSTSGGVWAIAADGSELWSITTGDWVHSGPAIGSDGTVYVGSYDGSLYALDPETGSEIWRYDAGDWLPSSPAVGPGATGSGETIYIGSAAGTLYALDDAGNELWSFDAGAGGVYSSPAVGDDGSVYFGSYDRNVYAVDASGNELWRFETGTGGVYSSPAIDEFGTVYVGSRDGTLYALQSGSAGPADSAWPMFGRTAERTAAAP